MNCIRQQVKTFHMAALLALFILRRNAGLCRARIPMSLKPSKSSHMLAAFLASVFVLSLAGATSALAQCTDAWTGGGGDGDWNNPVNWSTGAVPGSSDTACIETSGAAVSMATGGDGILNLTLGSTDSLTLPAGNNQNLNIGGTSIANSGQIILPGSQTATLYISSNSTTTLSGGGTVTLNSDVNDGISGFGPGGTLVNQETIQGAGGIMNDLILNNSSTGVVNANQSGAQLIVGRFFGTGINKGLMEATNGGQLIIGSVDLNNVGGTILASGTGSSVSFQGQGAGGQTITGGTFKTSSGGIINADNSTTIDGTNGNTITNAGRLALPAVGNNAGASFQGTINNKGTIEILSTSAGGVGLNIPGGQTFTLMGTGNLTMGDGTDNAYNNQNGISGGTFVNQQLIRGTGAIQNLTSFTNSGTINANVPTGPNNLQLQLGRAGASTNSGTLEATNGGVLVVGSTTIDNIGGTIEAVGTNSNVSLVGSLGTSGLTISAGTYTTSGGGVIYGYGGTTFDGTTNAVTNTGTFVIPYIGNPPNINVQGTLNNTGTIEIVPAAGGGDGIFLQIPSGENLTLTGNGKLIMGDGTDNSYNNLPVIGDDLGGASILTNQSTIEGSGVIASGTQGLINKGTINANVPVGTADVMLEICCEGSSGIVNSGTMEASNGGMLEIFPYTSFNNTGVLNAASGSTIYFNDDGGPFLNLVDGTLTGGTYTITGTLQIPGNITTNAAKITLTGTASQILNPSTNALAGFLTNTAMGGFTLAGGQSFTSAGTFTNMGTITISKGCTFTLGEGGSYVQTGGETRVDGGLSISDGDDARVDTAAGSIKIAKGVLFGKGGIIAASVSSDGTVVAADSATSTGELTVTGSYIQGASGALDANISGASSGEFSLLSIADKGTIGGTLNIRLLNNFVPLLGATFEILTAREVNGTFAAVNGTAINSSEHFAVTYNSNNVTLTVVSGT
jgi:hypothetical protein